MSALRPSNARCAREAGFSLIEILCAVIVLGVALVGLTEGLTTALRMGKEAERHTTAALLAAGRMETIRAEGDFIAGEETGDFGDSFAGYAWSQSIEETGLGGLYQVRVAVLLESTSEQLYELETFLFQMPILGLDGETTETGTERRRRRAEEEQNARRTTR